MDLMKAFARCRRSFKASDKTFAVSMTSVIGAAFVFAMLCFAPLTSSLHGIAAAQETNRNAFSVEANPFRGTLSYARATSPSWDVGFNLGFGFPQIDVTLLKNNAEFRDYFNIGGMARRRFGDRVLLEMGARAGFADYYHCTASDCWPEVYIGPSVMVAVGGKRVKVGSRLTAGFIMGSGHDLDVFGNLSPLNLLMSWRW